MPKKYDRCVKDVSKKINTGKIPKTYVKGGVRKKTNPYAICSGLRATGKKNKMMGVMDVSQLTPKEIDIFWTNFFKKK